MLAGVDILISVIRCEVTLAQKRLFAAAKEAGVKLVIPSDFATPGARGVRQLHDEVHKLLDDCEKDVLRLFC